MSEKLLHVNDLSVAYQTAKGDATAVKNVSFDLAPGEFLAIVGESGCGKSTLLFAIAQLLSNPARISGGNIYYQNQDLNTLNKEQLRQLRWREISVVMQSAMNALNPVLTIEAQLSDVCKAHTDWDEGKIKQRSQEVMQMVSIDPIHLKSYAFQLSGGMRQRAMIAMAMILNPKLVIMDEPTSALDVVAQSSLMVQIQQLRKELGFSVLFVTHDMHVVTKFSDRLAVMYAGEIVEIGKTQEIFANPKHPYTIGLLDAFPSLVGVKKELTGIPGNPPSLLNNILGCSFAPRCKQVQGICKTQTPPEVILDSINVRCHLLSSRN